MEKLTSAPMPGCEVLSVQPEDYRPAQLRNEWTVEYGHFDKLRKILLKEVSSGSSNSHPTRFLAG